MQYSKILESPTWSMRTAEDLDPLIDRLRQSRVVMLGEATHGTQEFYQWRRIITQRLIEEHGFNFVAVEGDWPPCQQIHHYISNSHSRDPKQVLQAFGRWPTWMWANTEVAKLIDWMHEWNLGKPHQKRSVGFHGLDVYSLFESIDVVLNLLQKVNPFLTRRAKAKYACFDRFHRDERKYAKSLLEFSEGCEKEVLQVLQDLVEYKLERGRGDGFESEPALLDATQNARIIKNAESYYRAMVFGREDSWNVRDRHMLETLELLMDQYGPDSRCIVWEHNSHIGDYRATEMLQHGQVNLGGIAREAFGSENVCLVGFGTHHGSVIASHAWDGPMEVMTVPAGKEGSYEALFHSASRYLDEPSFYLFCDESAQKSPLLDYKGHRAIGVVYVPTHERWGNYVLTSLARRYDAFIFLDETRALEPLNIGFHREEIPETWPMGQ